VLGCLVAWLLRNVLTECVFCTLSEDASGNSFVKPDFPQDHLHDMLDREA
jgi:hypothetical protein